MWIHTTEGFFSVGLNPNSKSKKTEIQVRARVKKDLIRIMEKVGITGKIREFTGTDYAYRIFTTKTVWAKYLADYAMGLDYDNFKNEVKKADKESGLFNNSEISIRQGHYFGCWQHMITMQNSIG